MTSIKGPLGIPLEAASALLAAQSAKAQAEDQAVVARGTA